MQSVKDFLIHKFFLTGVCLCSTIYMFFYGGENEKNKTSDIVDCCGFSFGFV